MLESDQMIWQGVTEGNKSSFKKLMQLYYNHLLNYGLQFSSDYELVKDCIQDLFLNLWIKRETVSKIVNVKAYLFSSLRRGLYRQLLRTGKTFSFKTFNDEVDYFNLQISIEQQFIKNESTERLAKKLACLLENLPNRQKEVIYLKFYHNLTRDEIAEAMKITPQTVSNLLQIALKKLKADFKLPLDPYILYFVLLIIKKSFF